MDNQEENDRIVLEVLCRLEENNLFIKPEKCTFKAMEVEFLGMIVGTEDIKMDHSGNTGLACPKECLRSKEFSWTS